MCKIQPIKYTLEGDLSKLERNQREVGDGRERMVVIEKHKNDQVKNFDRHKALLELVRAFSVK